MGHLQKSELWLLFLSAAAAACSGTADIESSVEASLRDDPGGECAVSNDCAQQKRQPCTRADWENRFDEDMKLWVKKFCAAITQSYPAGAGQGPNDFAYPCRKESEELHDKILQVIRDAMAANGGTCPSQPTSAISDAIKALFVPNNAAWAAYCGFDPKDKTVLCVVPQLWYQINNGALNATVANPDATDADKCVARMKLAVTEQILNDNNCAVPVIKK